MSLRFEPDVSQADWFAGRTEPWRQLGALGPGGYARYARLFHPAGQGDDAGDPDDLMNRRGDLEPATLQRLLTVLGRHTTTPGDCFFGLWEGFGWIRGSPSIAMYQGFVQRRLARQAVRLTVAPAFPPEVMAGPRVRIPARDYLLFRGPLGQAGQWGAAEMAPGQPRPGNSPNLMWPADRAWFVATEIDLPWTGIGGSVELVDDLLAAGSLDVERVEPGTDPGYWRGGTGPDPPPS